jgi:hypothetical protein
VKPFYLRLVIDYTVKQMARKVKHPSALRPYWREAQKRCRLKKKKRVVAATVRAPATTNTPETTPLMEVLLDE